MSDVHVEGKEGVTAAAAKPGIVSLGDFGEVRYHTSGAKALHNGHVAKVLEVDRAGTQAETIIGEKVSARQEAFQTLKAKIEADPAVKTAQEKLTKAQGARADMRGSMSSRLAASEADITKLDADIKAAKKELTAARKTAMSGSAAAETKAFGATHTAVQNTRGNVRAEQAKGIRTALADKSGKALSAGERAALTSLAGNLEKESSSFLKPSRAATAAGAAKGSWLGKHPVRNSAVAIGAVVGGYALYKMMSGDKKAPEQGQWAANIDAQRAAQMQQQGAMR